MTVTTLRLFLLTVVALFGTATASFGSLFRGSQQQLPAELRRLEEDDGSDEVVDDVDEGVNVKVTDCLCLCSLPGEYDTQSGIQMVALVDWLKDEDGNAAICATWQQYEDNYVLVDSEEDRYLECNDFCAGDV